MSESSTSATTLFVQNGDPYPKQHGLPRKQPMVELIESNSKLNHDLDRVRKETKQCLYDIEATKENIERLIEIDRLEIIEQTKNAVQEREDLLKTLEATQANELVEMQEAEYMAKVARDQAHDRLRVAQQVFLDQYEKFRENCTEYRSKIQRLSCQGESLGLKNHLAPLLACAVLHGHQPPENGTHNREDTENTANVARQQEQWNLNFNHIVASLAGSLDVGDDTLDDVELEVALQELEKRKTRAKLAHDCLEEVLKEKDDLLRNQEKRDLHKNGLQAQFQRLNDDVCKLRSQIKNFQQQTEETNTMTSIYQKGK
jgi:hypothetical protein